MNANGAWWSSSTNLNIYPAAHSFAPGVTAGTWASYDIDISNYPLNSLSTRLTVVQVDGTNVTYMVELFVNHVLQNSTTALINVYFGTESYPLLPVFLVASNLAVGDQVYPGQPQSISIQTQQNDKIAGAYRTVSTAGSPLSYTGLQITAAWDAKTGILSSLNATVPVNQNVVNAHYTLTGTNAWTPNPTITLSVASQNRASLLTPVKFSSTVSGGTPPYSYSWNFGDGTTSTDPNPLHSYPRPGNYTEILRVTDRDGRTESASTHILVSGLSPQTVFSIPSTVLSSWQALAYAAYLAFACVLAFLILRQSVRRKGRSFPQNSPQIMTH